jgi:hypothetical protein
MYDRSSLWVLGNYSFFVRSGYQRIRLNNADTLAGLMGTAYLSPDQSKIVVVYVNMASSTQKIATTFDHLPAGLQAVSNKVYITNSSYNLKKYGNAASESYSQEREISLPARSVATVVYELKIGTALPAAVSKKEAVRIYPNPAEKASRITLQLPAAKSADASIFFFGRKIAFLRKMGKYKRKADRATTGELVQGVYPVRIQCDGIYY